MKISKQHGCQLWLNTVAAWGVSNIFHVDDCLKSAINHYMCSCESLLWRIGSQDPNIQTACQRQIFKSLGHGRMAQWLFMFVCTSMMTCVQILAPMWKSRCSLHCRQHHHWRQKQKKQRSLRLASCQLSYRFRERPCLKGLRQRVTEQDTQCLPVASMCKGTDTTHIYTRVKNSSEKKQGWKGGRECGKKPTYALWEQLTLKQHKLSLFSCFEEK